MFNSGCPLCFLSIVYYQLLFNSMHFFCNCASQGGCADKLSWTLFELSQNNKCWESLVRTEWEQAKNPSPVSCAARTRQLVSHPEVGVACSGKHESISTHYPRLWRVHGRESEGLWVSVEIKPSNLSVVPADLYSTWSDCNCVSPVLFWLLFTVDSVFMVCCEVKFLQI